MREYIVFVSKDHYNPVGIVRTLGEAGIHPIVVVVKGDLRMVSKSKYVKKTYFVNSTEEGLELIIKKFANSKTEKSFILTGDDVTVQMLDAHYDELKDYFYFYNAGKTGRIRHFMNKDVLNDLAEKVGFRTPKTWKVNIGEIPEDIFYPIITKAIHSFGKEWKDIVYICHNDEELKEAYSKIKSEQILLQQYIEKVDEYGFQGFSVNRGKDVFVATRTNQAYSISDKYSPLWYLTNIRENEFVDKLKKMISEIGLEGIWEYEFIKNKEGELFFLEINFRITVIGWATTVAEMPNVTLWCESMKTGKIRDNIYRAIPDNFTVMAECFDYDVRVKSGMLSKKEWLKQYRDANAKLYMGRHDFRPFLAFMIYKYKKGIGK